MGIINFIIELAFKVVVLAHGVVFIPQLFRLYTSKNARELSLLTFGGLLTVLFIALLHTLVVQAYLLTIAFSFSVVVSGAVVWLIVWYRIKNG